MIQTRSVPTKATSYQFLSAQADELRAVQLPTGPVTVQAADEINNIPGRCYVPTTWGTAILNEGDWFVLFENGIVSAYTSAQHFLMLEEDVAIPEELPVEPVPDELLMEEPALFSRASVMSVRFDPTVDGGSVSEAPRELPVLRFIAGEPGSEEMFANYTNRYRLDYTVTLLPHVSDDPTPTLFEVDVTATGRVVARFSQGDEVVGYADGRMEVVG